MAHIQTTKGYQHHIVLDSGGNNGLAVGVALGPDHKIGNAGKLSMSKLVDLLAGVTFTCE